MAHAGYDGPRVSLRASGSSKSFERKARNVVIRRSVRRKVSDDLADDGREFETVAGAGRGHDQLREMRQGVDDEIAVGRYGVKTSPGVASPTVCAGDMVGKHVADRGLVVSGDRVIIAFRIDHLVGMVMFCDLDGF